MLVKLKSAKILQLFEWQSVLFFTYTQFEFGFINFLRFNLAIPKKLFVKNHSNLPKFSKSGITPSLQLQKIVEFQQSWFKTFGGK